MSALSRSGHAKSHVAKVYKKQSNPGILAANEEKSEIRHGNHLAFRGGFLIGLHVRNRTERQSEIYQEIGRHAEEPEVKEAIDARAFVSKQILAKLDECFRIIGEKPGTSTGKLHETFLEDFRKEVTEIQSPIAKRLFVLAKLNHLAHLRMAEYEVLVAAADLAGHHGVGVLLETCLADKLAFAERNRRLIRHLVETKLAERAAGASG